MTTLGAQARDFVAAALVALAVASAAFVSARNRDVVDGQLALAERSAHALAAGTQPLEPMRGGLVGPAITSRSHSFLTHREIREPTGAWHRLDDKLVYDAATRFARDHADHYVLADGTGRAVAVVRAPNNELAIAITEPAKPAPYPLLVMIGVLGLALALALAGALVDKRPLGSFAGIAALAVPPLLWSSWLAAGFIIALAAAVALGQRRGLTDRLARGLHAHRTALGFVTPAAIAMLVLVVAPFVIGLLLGFYDHHQGTWTFVGFHNFVEILSGGGRALDDPLNFWFILGVTVLWTICNIVLHVTIGVMLALVLSRTWLRGKGMFRMLLILPWAIPNYITALIWKGMFQGEYGAVNSLLHALHLNGVSWFSSWATAFSANVITNTWLGFPFMMVVALGALETIPKELYEAASVDGASAWQRFRHITLPHLRPALSPAIALGAIWTFNMFNVIYLVSGGKPGDSTNILVTDAYRWAFERGDRYGMAAAYATIIFAILLLWTVFGTRIIRTKGDTT
ncbi:MAG TPA: sugar ABC transporter permease [Kofleriaceae bacterium]|jgi:ABC-type sugar transport system permease subunit